MVGLIETLQREHEDMARLLDEIEAQFSGESEIDLDLLHEVLNYCLTYPDQYHHPKENLIYHQLTRHDPRVGAALEDLVAEHEELATATKELADLVESARHDEGETTSGLAAVAQAFVADYRRHIDHEERLFFPDAIATLDPDEWADLEARVTDVTDPMFRETQSDRLARIFSRVVRR